MAGFVAIRDPARRSEPAAREAGFIVVGTIPIAIVGIAAKHADRRPAAQCRRHRGGSDRLVGGDGGRRKARRPESRRAGLRLPRRRGHGRDAVLRAGAGGVAFGRDHQRRPVSRDRPGVGDPAVVLPRDSGPDGSDRARTAQGLQRLGVGAGNDAGRHRRSRSSWLTRRWPGCCDSSPDTRSARSFRTGCWPESSSSS